MNGNIEINAESKKFIKKYDYIPTTENMKLTSIILVTYNGVNYTQLCIESIKKFTDKDFYEIIVVDNGSSDNTVKWLKKQEDLVLILNDENKGFPAACNQGIKIANGESILLLNNDTIVSPNWLNNLNKALYSEEKVAGVGAITNSCSNNQQIGVKYENIAEMIEFAKGLNNSNSLNWEYRPRLIGYCYMFKAEILKEIGLLDERFTLGNYEDDDISFRFLEKGYKLILCKDVFIHHFGGASFGRDEKFVEISTINEKKFIEKWRFNVRYSALVRTDILALLEGDITKELNVLEVGCGIGATLLEIKNKFKKANIYGVEISEAAGKIAKGVCEGIIGNIENITLSYEEEFFDYIILGDVLEHLINPWAVLEKLKKHLKKEGYILASIPNIMHYAVMRNLLNGRFKYEEAGILDKTHLRFFTLAEINEMFAESGYIINQVNGTVIQPTKEDEEFIDKLCTLGNEELKQQFNIYQYILKAQKKEESKNDFEFLEKLKIKLLRIDNNLEVDDSIDYILKNYNKFKENLAIYVKSLVEVDVINKNEVLDKIIHKAKLEGFEQLAKELQ